MSLEVPTSYLTKLWVLWVALHNSASVCGVPDKTDKEIEFDNIIFKVSQQKTVQEQKNFKILLLYNWKQTVAIQIRPCYLQIYSYNLKIGCNLKKCIQLDCICCNKKIKKKWLFANSGCYCLIFRLLYPAPSPAYPDLWRVLAILKTSLSRVVGWSK